MVIDVDDAAVVDVIFGDDFETLGLKLVTFFKS